MVKKKDDGPPPEENGVDMKGLIKSLNKEKRSAYSFLEREDPSEIKQWIPTGSTLLDYAISNRPNGGIPYGRITEFNGLESSGKSLLAFHVISNAQKRGGFGLILDTEDRLLEKDFLVRLGVDPSRLAIDNPGHIEGCFEAIEKTIAFVRNKESAKKRPIVIVWDSIAATPPLAELEGTYDPQSQMGLGAKAVARGLRKLSHTIGVEDVALIIINQLRHNMKAMPFSDPWTTPYGKSLSYAASVRLRLTKSAKLKDADKELVGELTNIKVFKNSLGPPLREIEVPLIHGYGVDDQQSLYNYLKAKGYITVKAQTSVLKIDKEAFEFPTKTWKAWLADKAHRKMILDFLEVVMVKKYDDHNPAKDMQLTVEGENHPLKSLDLSPED